MDLPFPAEDLARLYRFALLMTGEEGAAQQVLYDACQGCAARLGGYRNHSSAYACLLESIRTRAKSALPAAPETAAAGIAAAGTAGTGVEPGVVRAFAVLPEPERAALGMLYAGLLPAREIAEVLRLSLEQLAAQLKSARAKLRSGGMAPGDGKTQTEATP